MGITISRSGLAKRAVTCEACWLVGVKARRLVGRLERGSCEVGIDSGIGSDIFFNEIDRVELNSTCRLMADTP